jgi:hypothetical protein
MTIRLFVSTIALLILGILMNSAFIRNNQGNKDYSNKIYSTTKFEISAANKHYHTELPGKVYFMDDSLAVYLYDSITRAVVLYDYEKINELQYSAKVKNVSKPFIFWFYQDVLFIEHKHTKYKIYLGEEIKQ